jgi:hypothetical protein
MYIAFRDTDLWEQNANGHRGHQIRRGIVGAEVVWWMPALKSAGPRRGGFRSLRAALRGSMPTYCPRQLHYCAMDQSMMDATKREREFIAGLAAQGPRLGEAQVPPPFTTTNLKAAFVRSIQQEPSVAADKVSFAFC